MNALAPTRPTELHEYRARLARGPAAPAEARRQVRAAIYAWSLFVDPDVAVLLAGELVTNAIIHVPDGPVTFAISSSLGALRVDVHDTSTEMPVVLEAPADTENGRGLLLVASMASEWGYYRTLAGKAVYFVLPSLEGSGRGDGGLLAPRQFDRPHITDQGASPRITSPRLTATPTPGRCPSAN